MSEMYTCKQVADRYGVKTLTVWKWIRTKKLSAVRIGRSYLIRKEDMEAFENARVTITPDDEADE